MMKDYLTAEEARKLNRTSDKEINRYLTEILNLVYEGAKDGKLACIYEKRGNKLPQEVIGKLEELGYDVSRTSNYLGDRHFYFIGWDNFD